MMDDHIRHEPPSDAVPPETAGADVPIESAAEPPPIERRLSRRAAWLAMGLVTLVLGLVWMAPSAVPHDEEFPEDAALVGLAAPLHYTLKDMNGVDVKLESFKGKIILLNFWATWCGPCKVEVPDLVELQEQFDGDLVVLGFSIDDSTDKLQQFAADYQVSYPLLVGLGREDVQDAYGPIWALPSTVLIDREGRIARKFTGPRTREQFEREINELL